VRWVRVDRVARLADQQRMSEMFQYMHSLGAAQGFTIIIALGKEAHLETSKVSLSSVVATTLGKESDKEAHWSLLCRALV
jgi:hypothetical protein